MSSIECTQCGSHDYQLLDSKTGEVMCPFCRSRWIVPSLIQKTETEKFLELQTQQPRVMVDNTSETDEKIMDIISGMLNMGGCLRKTLSIVIGIAVIIILIILALVLFNVFS